MFGLFKSAAPGSFYGGLKLEGHKLHGEKGRIQAAPLPQRVVLPVSQHIGAPTKPLVEVGQRVLRGQCIADSDGMIAAPIHASISGTVVSIGPAPVPHASGLPALCITIESDGLDEAVTQSSWPACEDPYSLDAATLRERVRAAGLVGLGGAGFPSAVKLNPGRSTQVRTLILNGAECEPYISCDAALMTERADEVIAGAELIRRVLGAHEALIGIEDNSPDAARELRAAIKAAGHDKIQLRVVPTRYPQGGEKQLIQTLTGQEVPSEGLPLNIGIVVQNVGTAAAIWRALRYAQPLISRIVTVNGPGITHPQNLEVRLGTPVASLIAHCGGYTHAQPRLIMGGPMMGFALGSDQVPVVKATNCILVEVAEAEPADNAMPCIRCGECVDVCPAHLLPQQLYWHARGKDFDKAQNLNLFDCIECGCCAQVCPSNIPLVQYYRYAKTEIYQSEQERRKADIARNRHEFRLARLEQEAQEKEEARRRKREALQQKQTKAAEASSVETAQPNATPTSAKPASDAIAAALANAKALKAASQSNTETAKPSDAVAAAIAKAKAAKAGKTDASDAPPAAANDAVAAAIAKAKARQAQKPEGEVKTGASDAVIAAAIAKAQARKAAKLAAAESDAPATEPKPEPKPKPPVSDAVAAAIAKAQAAKAAKATEPASTPSAPAPNDAVAAAIAKAKAAKAAREPQS